MLTLERWSALWSCLGARTHGDTIFQEVIQAYAEPHRHYHTLAHLQDCLQIFDTTSARAKQPAVVEAALWFHDAIYDTHSSENEARSASWAYEALRTAGAAEALCQHVADLVLMTQHEARPAGADACLIVDIDLSILGRAPVVFDAYERQIREEYAWVPTSTFRQRRVAILEAFLARPTIYSTPDFQQDYEEQARQNLARSIARLQA